MASKKQQPGKSPQPRTIIKRDRFLKAFRLSCSVRDAAQKAGMNPSTHYEWMRTDKDYAQRFADGLPEAAGNLEDDAMEWARVGIFTPNTYQGKFIPSMRAHTMCTLSDGTNRLEEELPKKHPKIVSRRTVHMQDGPLLGKFYRSENIMLSLLRAWLPHKYAPPDRLNPGSDRMPDIYFGANGGSA